EPSASTHVDSSLELPAQRPASPEMYESPSAAIDGVPEPGPSASAGAASAPTASSASSTARAVVFDMVPPCWCGAAPRPLLSHRILVPVDRAGHERVRAERAAEHALRLPRGGEQRVEVDPRLDAHLVQHRDEVLARDVAGRAGRDGAAAE